MSKFIHFTWHDSGEYREYHFSEILNVDSIDSVFLDLGTTLDVQVRFVTAEGKVCKRHEHYNTEIDARKRIRDIADCLCELMPSRQLVWPDYAGKGQEVEGNG